MANLNPIKLKPGLYYYNKNSPGYVGLVILISVEQSEFITTSNTSTICFVEHNNMIFKTNEDSLVRDMKSGWFQCLSVNK